MICRKLSNGERTRGWQMVDGHICFELGVEWLESAAVVPSTNRRRATPVALSVSDDFGVLKGVSSWELELVSPLILPLLTSGAGESDEE